MSQPPPNPRLQGSCSRQQKTVIHFLRAVQGKFVFTHQLKAFYKWRLFTYSIGGSFNFKGTLGSENSLGNIVKELRDAAEESKTLSNTIKELETKTAQQALIIDKLKESEAKTKSVNKSSPFWKREPFNHFDFENFSKSVTPGHLRYPLQKICDNSPAKKLIRQNLNGFQLIFTQYSQPCRKERTVGTPGTWIHYDESPKCSIMTEEAWIDCAKSLCLSPDILSRRSTIQIFRQCAVLEEGKLVLGLDEMISCFFFASKSLEEIIIHPKGSKWDSIEYLLTLLCRKHHGETYFPNLADQLNKNKTIEFISMAVSKAGTKKLGNKEAEEEAKFLFIFNYYCAFGDRQNSTLMSATKFCKMCRECEVINNNSIRQHELDICFKAILADYRKRLEKKKQEKPCIGRLPYEQIQKVMALVGRRHFPGRSQHSSRKAYNIIREIILRNFATKHSTRDQAKIPSPRRQKPRAIPQRETMAW